MNFFSYTKTNPKGGRIYDIQSLSRLFELEDVLMEDHSPFIDLKTVYKWPNLEQNGYKIDIHPTSWKVYSHQYVENLSDCMRINDITINFNDGRKQPLLFYIDSRIGLLRIFYRNGISKTLSPEKNEPDSKIVSKILSCSMRGWKNDGEIIGGKENIFESNELVDQLFITTLLNSARNNHQNSQQLLLTLIDNRIRNITKKMLENNKYIDLEEFIDLGREFSFKVIIGDENLAKRFRFIPSNNFSLYHFLVAWMVSNNNKNHWIPKLQEFLSDEIKSTTKKEKRIVRIEDDNQSIKDIEDKDYLVDINDYEIAKKINDIVLTWPERDRIIFNLKHKEEMTLDEIGKKFGIKKSYVSKILNKRKQEIISKVRL